jgi:hypothetical protein
MHSHATLAQWYLGLCHVSIAVRRLFIHHHHKLINVPTAGAQAFLMDYLQGERVIAHHADPVRIGGG